MSASTDAASSSIGPVLLTLVCSVLRHSPAASGGAPVPASLADLSSGTALANFLHVALPHVFDADIASRTSDNWIVHRTTLNEILDKLQSYSKDVLSAKVESVIDGVDTAAIAREKSIDQIVRLVELAVTVSVFSGSQDVLSKVRQLEKADNDALGRHVKTIATRFGLSKAKKPAEGASSSTNLIVASGSGSTSPAPAGVATSGALREFDAAFSPDAFRQLQQSLDRCRAEAQQSAQALQLLNAKHELLSCQHEELEGKYKKVVDQEVARGTSQKERDLQVALSKRDEMVIELQRQVSGLTSDVHREREKSRKLDEDHIKLVAEHDAQSDTLRQVRAALKERDAECSLASDKLAALMANRQRMDDEISRMMEEAAIMKAQTTALKDQLAKAKSEGASVEVALKHAQEKITALEHQVAAGSVTVEGMVGGAGAEAWTVVQDLRDDLEAERATRHQVEAELQAMITAKTTTCGSGIMVTTTTSLLEAAGDDDDASRLASTMNSRPATAVNATSVTAAAGHGLAPASALETTSSGSSGPAAATNATNEEWNRQRIQIETAKKAMLSERAVLVSSVFDAGVRNSQLTQLLTASAMASPPPLFGRFAQQSPEEGGLAGPLWAAFGFGASSSAAINSHAAGGGEATFLERQRASFQQGLISYLARPKASLLP